LTAGIVDMHSHAGVDSLPGLNGEPSQVCNPIHVLISFQVTTTRTSSLVTQRHSYDPLTASIRWIRTSKSSNPEESQRVSSSLGVETTWVAKPTLSNSMLERPVVDPN
jgi:hypothetical protein